MNKVKSSITNNCLGPSQSVTRLGLILGPLVAMSTGQQAQGQVATADVGGWLHTGVSLPLDIDTPHPTSRLRLYALA